VLWGKKRQQPMKTVKIKEKINDKQATSNILVGTKSKSNVQCIMGTKNEFNVQYISGQQESNVQYIMGTKNPTSNVLVGTKNESNVQYINENQKLIQRP
ncbi:13254_t:CDS:2, partial [Racocetra persica]